MKTITLTDNEGTRIEGAIPEGWHEVPLSAFINYHQLMSGKPAPLAAVVAASCLTGLPTEAVQSDVSLAPLILRQMPWLSELPQPEPMLSFKHGKKTYEHVGNLERIDAAQFEALLSFLEAAEGNPIAAAPNLLAVLCREKGKAQTAESVAAAAEAFASLPMDKAWGAVAFFLTSSQPYAGRIRSLSQAQEEAEKALKALDQLVAQRLPKRSSRIAARLVRAYTRSARAMLRKS
ncbi:hypothetical protein [Pontibacter mangrovi]|uniref:Uncharacterized protein n=1 Tax=Pontibacter mangrovi TaxID=2589816 RepID=A0A501WA49_9BACT|nr:hypothetical protein [Pontibacter mangrovi]TPE44944.1 hypothetical protein FJM65_07980 [Pontibacter mangrovi]